MLQNLSEEICECYRHAEHCHAEALAAADPARREEDFEMEKRWLFLARSYELSERVSRYTETVLATRQRCR